MKKKLCNYYILSYIYLSNKSKIRIQFYIDLTLWSLVKVYSKHGYLFESKWAHFNKTLQGLSKDI
jgi:hypothetical protein